jgi:hypothetical protein
VARSTTKFHWDTSELLKRYDQATRDTLKWAGMDTRRSIQRQMSQRSPASKPTFYVVKKGKPERRVNAIRDSRGRFLKRKMGGGETQFVAAVYRVPKPDKVTSWKTSQFPKGFLNRSIESDWDGRTKSVVVGAAKAQWLADLHDIGGQATFSFVPPAQTLQQKFRDMRKGKDPKGTVYGFLKEGDASKSLMTIKREISGKSFMQIGYFAVRGKIMKKFQDALHRTGSAMSVQNS